MESGLKIIKIESEVDELIAHCKKTGYCSNDYETTCEKVYEASEYPLILGVAFQSGFSWVIPLGHSESPFKKIWEKVLIKFGKEVIENPDIVKICWNAKFEYKWWKRYGITMQGRVFDGMLAKYLLNEERPSDLKSMVNRYLPEFGGYELNLKGRKWAEIPMEELSLYCGIDADATLRLMLFFETKLIKLGFYNLFRNMMMMATRVLAESELHGMKIDKKYLKSLVHSYGEKLDKCDADLRDIKLIKRYEIERTKLARQKLITIVKNEIDDLNDEINKAKKDKLSPKEFVAFASKRQKRISNLEQKVNDYLQNKFTTKKDLSQFEPLNFNSPKQLIELLFESEEGFKFKVVKYTVDKKTKKETDSPSTDEDVLTQLKPKDKTGFIDLLLTHRELSKLYSTYILGMYEKLSTESIIHTSFLLHGTVTGRLCLSRDCILYTRGGGLRLGNIIPKNNPCYKQGVGKNGRG